MSDDTIVQLPLRMPRGLRRALKMLATKRDTSITGLVNRAIEQALAAELAEIRELARRPAA
jgi:predicted transcriptional regulator